MEIDLNKLKIPQIVRLCLIIIVLTAPIPIFFLIYDYKLFMSTDTWKIILVSIAGGGLAYTMIIFPIDLFLAILKSITGIDRPHTQDGEIDFDDLVATIFTQAINVVVIGNLLFRRFYQNIIGLHLIKATLNTWVLCLIVFYSILCFILITLFVLYKIFSIKGTK